MSIGGTSEGRWGGLHPSAKLAGGRCSEGCLAGLASVEEVWSVQ